MKKFINIAAPICVFAYTIAAANDIPQNPYAATTAALVLAGSICWFAYGLVTLDL